MKKAYSLLTSFALSLLFNPAYAQGPEVTSWIINTTGATGYNNIPSNVQLVRYGAANVYVSTTCVPSYSIGPWPGNPNVPSNQNFVFKITRSPVQNTGTPVNTGLGHIGVWSNGVSIFNALDAMSYQNQNVWHQNAQYWEGSSFDNCLGHPAPNGEYHHHVNPTCLYDDHDSLNHSPIIGYAFDGFPIYGAYGYANALTPGPVKRMLSSYQLRNITVRDSLPNGQPASSSGPNVGGQYPLGAYVEDYAYVSTSGDLDNHNGRYCVTPDYPSGTYAYFVTIDENLEPVYPYVIGTSYYGTVQSGNTGPGSGHNTPSETVVTYNPSTGISTSIDNGIIMYPNPAGEKIHIKFSHENNGIVSLSDLSGKIFKRKEFSGNLHEEIELSDLASGVYFVEVLNQSGNNIFRIVKE